VYEFIAEVTSIFKKPGRDDQSGKRTSLARLTWEK
jgi:hypothetical protein